MCSGKYPLQNGNTYTRMVRKNLTVYSKLNALKLHSALGCQLSSNISFYQTIRICIVILLTNRVKTYNVDRENNVTLNLPWAQAVIYLLHAGCHPGSPVAFLLGAAICPICHLYHNLRLELFRSFSEFWISCVRSCDFCLFFLWLLGVVGLLFDAIPSSWHLLVML